MRHPLHPALLVAVAVALASRADTLRLANGQTLDGMVVTQDARQVVIDVGTGIMTLRRSQVVEIAKAAPGAVESEWRAHYFLHPRFVPPAYTNVAEALRRLQDERRSALAALAEVARARQAEAQLGRDIEGGKAQVAEQRERLQQVDTNAVAASQEAWEAYAKQIAAFNARQAGLAEKVDQLQAGERRISEGLAAESRYLRMLDEAGRLVEEMPSSGDPAVTGFVARARAEIAEHRRDVLRIEAPARWSNGHAVVDVRINGGGTARLLLDTGATLVTLHEPAARRLGVRHDTSLTATTILADGRRTTVWPVFIERLDVGEATSWHVAAVVMPGDGEDGVDGLLGMSFLRDYTVRVDAFTGRVEFLRLAPPAR